ncbi:MAG: hypothetical protein LBQ61_03210 [Spirochaetales bacterium]|nr:hypothetical protein [Spirochaetales bacterium]
METPEDGAGPGDSGLPAPLKICLSRWLKRGMLFLFFLNLILVFFYATVTSQELQDETILGLQVWLERFLFLYLLLGGLFFVQKIVERVLFGKGRPPGSPGGGFSFFAILSLGAALVGYALLFVSRSLGAIAGTG